MYVARSVTYIAAAVLGLCMFTPPKARADAWNQRTIVTFSGPVEIPGRVLPAGTYTFKLLDSQSDRNIVEVLDKNEQHTYGTFLAVPDYRLNPSGKVIITFRERAAGAPEALRAWFYPGDNYGHEFVYPKVQAEKIAQATGQNVPSTSAENYASSQTEPSQSEMSSMKQSQVQSSQPSQQETPLGPEYTNQQAQTQAQQPQTETTTQPQTAETMNNQSNNATSTQEANREAQETTPPPQPSMNTEPQQTAQNNPNTQNPPAQLPQTGSDLPLIALIGLLSLGTAGSLRFAAAKMK